MISCPYIRKHKVEPRKFASHIEKCRKQLPQKVLSKYAACKYNSLHIFPIFDIEAHELNCPNKRQMAWLQNILKQESSRILAQEISKASQSISQSINENPHQKDINKQVVSGIKQFEQGRKKQNQQKCTLKKQDFELTLQQCKLCSSRLCDANIALWKNKKLVKYLKAYQKLEQQHTQILAYMNSLQNIFSKNIRKKIPSVQINTGWYNGKDKQITRIQQQKQGALKSNNDGMQKEQVKIQTVLHKKWTEDTRMQLKKEPFEAQGELKNTKQLNSKAKLNTRTKSSILKNIIELHD